ncbi:CRIB domain-containing protein RIC4-like isoform X1 [Senna tora]|uniref:CRIB domain-containing protein RIC4-like isoform X1 n=1 Tax=Senna tora TaxID=362788 RepID=A0A834X2C6_9FABA|nr:CRIB domain-containing protein RIC4-like isoform X1 [Senna tora]
MRDKMERFLVLPFSFGCASHSSVELGAPKADSKASASVVTSSLSLSLPHLMMKTSNKLSSSGFLQALPKPNIVGGIQNLIRGIKSLSQFFFYKEEEMEEIEAEMEIGFPTDVKHLTHIGLDGSTTTNNVRGWDNLKPPPELLSFSSISFKQFEIAMAAQAQHPPLTAATPSKFG